MWTRQRIAAWVGVLIAFAIQQILAATVPASPNTPGHDDSQQSLAENMFNSKLAIGTPLIFFSGLLSAGGGLGGGGLYIPIFVLALGYDPHFAVPLSKATIVGVAYGGFLVNYKRRHPLADRPLIDYDTALLLQPMLLIGTIIGVSLNVIFPGVLITILLILLLAVVSYKTLKKGWSLYRAEIIMMDRRSTKGSFKEGLLQSDSLLVSNGKVISSKSMDTRSVISIDENAQMDDTPIRSGSLPAALRGYARISTESDADKAPTPRKTSSFNIQTPKKVTANGGINAGEGIQDSSKEIQEILRDEAKTPWGKFAMAVCVLGGIILIAIFKGGATGQPSIIGVNCGTYQYWLVLASSIPYLGGITFLFARMILRRSQKKMMLGYPYVNGDIKWAVSTVIGYPLFACFAGACAGCLGIGGGLVLGPLLLEIGLYPPVVSATAAFTIIFTSTSITTQFIILGRLNLGRGIWYCGVGFIAAILGHWWVKAMVKKYKKVSLISLVLGGAVGFSAAVLVVTSVLELVNEGTKLSFNGLCDPAAGE